MSYGTFRQSVALLATRRFGTFWFASLLSNIGTWAQQVAEPWLLLSLGASSFLVGLDTFAMSAPVWLLTLAGGALADRADRRWVIASFQSVQMLCPMLIVVLIATGHLTPWIVIGLSAVVGITDALSMPSFSSIVPTIVAHEQIPAALALNATQFNLSRIAGPALAGVLMATIGTIGCFAANAASYLPFIAVAVWILPSTAALRSGRRSGRAQAAATGSFRTVLAHRDLRSVLVVVSAAGMLCGPLVTFYPVLVRDALHGDAMEFSVGVAAFGVGGLLGAFALLAIPAGYDRRHLSLAASLAYGATLVAAGADPWRPTLPLVLLLAGLAMSVTNISANTFVQETASAATRGRAVSLYMLAMRGGIALGAVGTGWLVDVVGIRTALLADGLTAIAVQLACWTLGARPRPA